MYLNIVILASLLLECLVLMYSMNQGEAANTPLVEFPSAGTTTSSPLFVASQSPPLVSTVPELQEQQSECPLPGTSESPPPILTLPVSTERQHELSSQRTTESSGVFKLPESPEQLQELGITEESSPFNEAHRSGNDYHKISVTNNPNNSYDSWDLV